MRKILIVDDIPTNLYLLESILKGNGFEVIPARNGAEALAAARQSVPDLIITDILMPVMDGFELCRQWKADERLNPVPFIFYTATYTDPRDEQLARNLGAEGFLIKPLKPDHLMREISAILDESRKRKADHPAAHPREEKEILLEYNEVLFRKLESKVKQLEAEITERKTIQEQREFVIRELEQRNAELAQFTHAVSHELRNPLITIKGFATLIGEEVEKGSDTAELKKNVRQISLAVDTMDALLADLQLLSRAGRSLGLPERVGFSTLVGEAVDLLSQLIENRGVRVKYPPDLPAVLVDHARVRELLVNLIENSIRFMGDQKYPVISIGADTTGKTPEFFIRDNGTGIDPRYLDRVFILFEKLDDRQPGTGIGLTIARRIVEAHGGRIRAISEGKGRGTMVCFTLAPPSPPGTDTNNNG